MAPLKISRALSRHHVPRTCLRQPYRCLSSAQSPQPQPPPSEPTTHFGFQIVASSQKEEKVATVFSSVASSYDTMNDLMSLGIHRLWKDDFVRGMNPGSPSSSQPWKILDIAGGTGDIAFRLLEHARLVHGDTRTSVTVADINPNMLAEGRKRAQATSYAPPSAQLDFVEANAETLPDIPSDSIDLYTVAFGIRNFTDKPRALREAYRVLKPGGVFACLEFGGGGGESSGGAASGAGGGVTNPVLRAAYARWSFSAIPLLGQLVAADRDSYQYLVESIARFPSQSQFRDMIRDAGFLVPGGAEESGGWTDLTGGIAAVHKGVKPVR